MKKLYYLLNLKLKSIYLRIFYCSADEKTSVFCIFILLFFILSLILDFSDKTIIFIAPGTFKNLLLAFVFILLATYTGKILHRDRVELDSYYSFLKNINENSKTINFYLLINRLILSILASIGVFFIANSIDYTLSSSFIVLTILMFLFAAKFFEKIFYFVNNHKEITSQKFNSIFKLKNRINSLTLWRETLAFKSKSSKLFIICAFVLMVLIFFLIFKEVNNTFIYICCWFMGLSIAFAVISVVAISSKYNWLEKQAGVSHDNIVSCLNTFIFKLIILPSLCVFFNFID